MREELSAGAYQLSLVITDLAEALAPARQLRPLLRANEREGCDQAIEFLDGAGVRLAELELAIPDVDDKKLEPIKKLWIDSANDSRFEARQAAEFFSGVSDFGKEPAKSAAAKVVSRIEGIVEGLRIAIEEMGGKVEEL